MSILGCNTHQHCLIVQVKWASRYWSRPLPSSSGPTMGKEIPFLSRLHPSPSLLLMLCLVHTDHQRGNCWIDLPFCFGGCLYSPSSFSDSLPYPAFVPYNWYYCRVFPRDSSLKTLNCFPKVSSFSARAWFPWTPHRQEASALPPCLEATRMLYLQPEWTLRILSSTLLHPYLFMSNYFRAREPRLIPTKILSE